MAPSSFVEPVEVGGADEAMTIDRRGLWGKANVSRCKERMLILKELNFAFGDKILAPPVLAQLLGYC